MYINKSIEKNVKNCSFNQGLLKKIMTVFLFQSPNVMNLSRVSNPPKTGVN